MNDIARPNFDEMDIATLREYAAHLQVPLAKTAKKEEIKKAILHKLAGRTAVRLPAKGEKTPPGHAKIIIAEDPNPQAKQIPVYFNVNGYVCTIPRGKEVIVPMRILRALDNAKVNRIAQVIVQDDWGRETYKQTTVRVQSYPYQLIDKVEGDEPLTNVEQIKRRTQGPKQRYKAMFGRYPKPRDLERAIEKGLIKVHDEEISPVSDMIEVDDTEE